MPLTQKDFVCAVQIRRAEDPNELIKILKFFIEDGTIRATRPHDFNDPAEFKAKFSFDATIQEKLVRYHEMWPAKATMTVRTG
ncbi:hypothetical protein [Klebsiella pneumoniae]|uniref:hypothetical protein n=1 Tax=Klebsiella pneumoniae TaxID=573 RepID=UPI0035D0F09E